MRAFYHLRATLRNLFELLWNKPFPAATKRAAFEAALASQDLALLLRQVNDRRDRDRRRGGDRNGTDQTDR
jgi:hypothetical protein